MNSPYQERNKKSGIKDLSTATIFLILKLYMGKMKQDIACTELVELGIKMSNIYEMQDIWLFSTNQKSSSSKVVGYPFSRV